MKITAIRSLLLSAPYAEPGDGERELHLRTGFRSATLIQVDTDEGLSGLGETYAGVYAPDAVRAHVQQLEDDLVGQDVLDTLAVCDRMRLATAYWGRTGLTQSTIGGIEMALWDLKGKALGVPVVDLLGGRVHDELPVYASGGNPKPLADLERELRAYVASGYRAIKVRINHLTTAGIVEKVARCRDVVGADIGVAVDAAQGLERRPWSVKQALKVARLITPYDLLWIEEPCAVTDYAGYAEVRRRSDVPIAGGETVTSLVEAEAYLHADALDLFQPDASMIGGISVFRRVAQMCERKFIPVAVHAWCSGVGIMGNYHAAFASPNCTILELPSVPNPLRDDVLVEPLNIVDGKVRAPSQPGLGVKLPDGLQDRYPYRPDAVYRVLVD